MLIESTYRDISIKKSYNAEIIWTKKGMKVVVSYIDRPSSQYGTKIRLICNRHPLTDENIKKIKIVIVLILCFL